MMTQPNGNVDRHRFDFECDDPDCGCHEYFSPAARLERIVAMSLEMAEDEGLWFQAQTCAEAYLQQELRKLMHVIEDTP